MDEGVRLEVLDWGGSGRPLVLLAGSGNTAHVFDALAPKLTDVCHVYAITRRGHGASSKPRSSHTDQRLADDVLAVLDTLKIAAPVLAGHSMAGGELTTLGRQHSERLSGLVYLDALADPRDSAGDPALFEKLPKPMQRPSCTEDRSSFAALRDYFACLHMPLPESELRQMFTTRPDGSVGRPVMPGDIWSAIGDGQVRRDYSNIRVPVLVLFEFPRDVDADPRPRPGDYRPKSEEERAAIEAFNRATKASVDRWVASLRRSVADARVVEVPRAGHFLFLTREAAVLRELRAFAASLAKR